jgi:hypothetical protein
MDPTLCPRKELITKLIEIMDRGSVVHVRGAPASGKTIIATFLHSRLRDAGRKVVFIRAWPPVSYGYEYRTFLVNCAAESGIKLDRDRLFKYNDVVFIMDEAQETYIHTDFWIGLIKDRLSTSCGTKVCLFTSYGNPAEGPINYPANSKPGRIDFVQRVGITPSLVSGGPQFGLFYNKEEFEDTLQRFNTHHSTDPLPLGVSARSYLFSMTNGHPGAVGGMMSFLQTV